MSLLWAAISDIVAGDVIRLTDWPLIPTNEGYLVQISPEIPVFGNSEILLENIRNLLKKIGIRTTNNKMNIPTPLFNNLIQQPTPKAILTGIFISAGKKFPEIRNIFSDVTEEERREFRSFLS